jgi:hypothetical protein
VRGKLLFLLRFLAIAALLLWAWPRVTGVYLRTVGAAVIPLLAGAGFEARVTGVTSKTVELAVEKGEIKGTLTPTDDLDVVTMNWIPFGALLLARRRVLSLGTARALAIGTAILWATHVLTAYFLARTVIPHEGDPAWIAVPLYIFQSAEVLLPFVLWVLLDPDDFLRIRGRLAGPRA